jgi:Cu(I)/Ag(I) efflux system membrane fusion protein
MNRNIVTLAALAAALLLGLFAGRSLVPSPGADGAGSAAPEREILHWAAPMDPSYQRDGPGKSPMGMDLVPVYADDVDRQPGVVSIDPTVVNNLGVRSEPASFGPLSRRIETVGYVAYDEDTVQHVHTRVEGWIERLVTKATGDAVRQGQLLFELYSPTLVNAQQEFLAAMRSNNSVLLDASRDRLAALGITIGEIDELRRDREVRQRVRVYAEADGVIAHLGVREGIFVTPATEVMSIAKLDRVWVIAEVFERQAGWVRPGQRAEVELDYVPGRKWRGTVDYVYPELDPRTRTLRVRLRFDNETEVLRPNMFARVSILGDSTAPVVHVPREALIRGGNMDRVVIALGDGRFRSRPVEVGVESGDRVAIREGLGKGERVVTSGQFLIDSESNIETALGRMSDTARAAASGRQDMPGEEQAPEDAEHDMDTAEETMDHGQHRVEPGQ